MLRLVLTGVLAALFFSSTFVLNRAMSLEGGHWLWTGVLRYGWMLLLLSLWLVARGRASLVGQTLRLYWRHWRFWTLAGGIGFGLFYALICFSAAYAPGWVVAATWQMTILATPVVLWLFGRRLPGRALLLTLLVFVGVVGVNVDQATDVGLAEVLLGALPVVVAAFAYPFGNQMVWEARTAAGSGKGAVIGGRLPRIDHPVMDDAICRVLLLTLGSLPFWLVLMVWLAPPAPSGGQLVLTLLVALFSGVVATTLFLAARHRATSPAELAAVDCTQSMEVLFSLGGEVLLLGGALPGPVGWIGILLTLLGLMLYLVHQKG